MVVWKEIQNQPALKLLVISFFKFQPARTNYPTRNPIPASNLSFSTPAGIHADPRNQHHRHRCSSISLELLPGLRRDQERELSPEQHAGVGQQFTGREDN